MCIIDVPRGAQEIINCLNRCDYDAYVVGGCVRDSLLGVEPKDWDICTSATPDIVLNLFQGKRIIIQAMLPLLHRFQIIINLPGSL